MNTVCRYAIVRFMPFVETGEFANVGIVMVCPSNGRITFKIEARKYGRITRFFEGLNRDLYLNTMAMLEREFTRIQSLADKLGRAAAVDLFEETVRPRETLIRFSNTRAIMTEDPLQELDGLFAFYVERNFVQKEYVEQLMEKAIRGLLEGAGIEKRFVGKTIGDGIYEAKFPFVRVRAADHDEKVIKPLHLGHEKPSEIIDVGLKWISKIGELRARKALTGQILLVVDEPNGEEKSRLTFDEMMQRFRESDIETMPRSMKDEIVTFART